MNKKEYNGWYNYETWACNLWHDAGWEEEVKESIEQAIEKQRPQFTIREEATFILEDIIKTYVEDNIPPELNTSSFYSDLINAALSEINYYDIAKHYIDDVDIYSAMWNMPGCMPETDPAIFTDEDEAKQYLIDAIREHADGDEEITDDKIDELCDDIARGESVEYAGYIYQYDEV